MEILHIIISLISKKTPGPGRMSTHQCTSTSRIRFGILSIEIEVFSVQTETCTCYHCEDEIEDELRFLYSCKVYRNLRNNLPYHDYYELNTADKNIMYFNNLLHNNNTTRVLIKFVIVGLVGIFAVVCTLGAWFLFYERLISPLRMGDYLLWHTFCYCIYDEILQTLLEPPMSVEV